MSALPSTSGIGQHAQAVARPALARSHACCCRLPAVPNRAGLAPSPSGRALSASAPRRARKVVSHAKRGSPQPEDADLEEEYLLPEIARTQLLKAAFLLRRWGWISFWSQISVSTVSLVILVFSVAFTGAGVAGPQVSLFLTLFGVMAAFLSVFWSYRLTRLSRRMFAYADALPGEEVDVIGKQKVKRTLWTSVIINLLGLGSTLIGVQATVGVLVAKYLTSSTVMPFVSGASGQWNPVLPLDVFMVQAACNTLLSHFASLCISLWLQHRVEPASPTPAKA